MNILDINRGRFPRLDLSSGSILRFCLVFLLGFFCIVFVCRGHVSSRDLLVSVAAGELGVKEATRHNDGRKVEEYLRYSGLKKGDPWCASCGRLIVLRIGWGGEKTCTSFLTGPSTKGFRP